MMACSILLLLTGCVTVRDYDAEKLEYERVQELKKAQKEDPFNSPVTPDYVKVADDPDEGIYVEVMKLHPITDPHGIKLDIWTVNAVSRSDKTKCVKIDWKLQDFEFESEQPVEFLIKKGETLHIGKMKQSIWSFDTTFIAIPPSGYVDSLHVRDADFDEKTRELTCDMLEEDVDEPKTDTDAIEM